MINTTKLQREFVFKNNGRDVVLTDPSAAFTPDQAINFYAGTYPVLTTAKLEKREIVGDKVQYRYGTTIGTKG